jgi:hypothetical protein
MVIFCLLLVRLINLLPEHDCPLPKKIKHDETKVAILKDNYKVAVEYFKSKFPFARNELPEPNEDAETIPLLWHILKEIICPKPRYEHTVMALAVDQNVDPVLTKWVAQIMDKSNPGGVKMDNFSASLAVSCLFLFRISSDFCRVGWKYSLQSCNYNSGSGLWTDDSFRGGRSWLAV